jgi:uncharacterized membrane protein YidH (DUF202 family)
MEHITSKSSSGEISVELAARRTGMSFQRTRMSADRTLMSVIRTSLALIGFGFTIFQFFEKLHTDKLITSGPHTTRHFGITLVALGILMLIGGIAFHSKFMLELRKMRGRPHSRRDQLPGVAHAHYRAAPAADRRRGDCEHAVSDRAVWVSFNGRTRGGNRQDHHS